jgi:hypothetical protein
VLLTGGQEPRDQAGSVERPPKAVAESDQAFPLGLLFQTFFFFFFLLSQSKETLRSHKPPPLVKGDLALSPERLVSGAGVR